MLTRRRFLGVLGVGALFGGVKLWPEDGFMNPCLGHLPPELANHDLLQAAWEGIDPAQVWDCHVHLIGTGDGGSGIHMHPDMENPLHGISYVQRAFYLNASCADAPGRVDVSFVERLRDLHEDFPAGYKSLLLAFDETYDEGGNKQVERTAFYTPNAYARSVAASHADRFEWIASVHPYRADCVEALEQAAAGGARAVKWLPPGQGMDPASPACDRFYNAMARLGLPLLTHAGEEQAVHGAESADFGNPLRLRRALDHGVKVIVAHCASLGSSVDLDQGADAARVGNFQLFARMMDEPRYEGLLFGDISATTQRNRDAAIVKALLERQEWHPRLLNGSDYPLPGVIPLFSLHHVVAAKLLAENDVPVLLEVRRHNALLFDFLLKRRLRIGDKRYPSAVFETRGFF